MADDINKLKMHRSMDTDTKDKKPMKPLIPAPVDGGSASDRERLCSPGHRIGGSSPVAAAPIHSPSFTSSPSADVASSEEESVAELGDVSEGECSSVEDYHRRIRRRQEEELQKDFGSGVVAVAKRLSQSKFKEPPQSSIPLSAVKCARFSEPADDSESLIDRPVPTPNATSPKILPAGAEQ